MFTHAKLILENNNSVAMWVKCNKLPYFYIYGFIPVEDYPYLKWKLKINLKIDDANIEVDPNFVKIYNSLPLIMYND